MHARLGLLLTLAIAAFPAVASAAPDKTGTVGAGTPTFAWDGSGSGVSDPIGVLDFAGANFLDCSAPAAHDCDDILIKVDDAGDMNLVLDAATDGTVVEDPSGTLGGIASYPDLDLYLFKSDASGAAQGDPLTTDCATVAADEKCTVKGLTPGFYLAQVEFFMANQESYKASAELTGFKAPEPAAPVVTTPVETPPAAPAPAEPAPAQSAPQPAPAKPAPASARTKKKSSAKAACTKKAKKVKNAKKRKRALKACAKKK
jgi:hypothetical protein